VGAPTRTALAATVTNALLAALLSAMLTGCDGQAPAASPEPPRESATTTATVERPHFRGHRPVTLTLGRVVVGDDGGCLADDAPEWVCDPAEDRPYLAFGVRRPADLVEARMDLAGGGTSWTVTARLAREDARDLRRLRALARSSGALVLVLDPAGDALLAVPVTDLERGVISLSQLGKPEAWSLVERIADA
jgi:hypothetical protein